MEKNYICVCGKQWESQKSLSAHQASCKQYYLYRDENLDVYNNRLIHLSEKSKEFFEKTSETRKEKQQKFKTEKLNNWISEQHRCECCGKIMTEYFGVGRFCSRACANSRNHTEETKQKISDGLNNSDKINHINKIKKYCVVCGNPLNFNNKSGYCKNCYKPTITEEQKLKQSETMKLRGYPRWNIHRNEPSFAEKFFKKVLFNNNIQYEFDYNVENDKHHFYILDFYINKRGVKIDLEIDGQQHEWEERKIHDKIRDEFLTSLGYIVYRIKWNEITSETGKQSMKLKIDEFIDFYNKL